MGSQVQGKVHACGSHQSAAGSEKAGLHGRLKWLWIGPGQRRLKPEFLAEGFHQFGGEPVP
jgi:hypothetical protein